VLYDVTFGPLAESRCIQLVRTRTGDDCTLRNHRAKEIFRATAGEQCARYEYSQSLLVCGQLGEKLGKQGARQQIEQAEAQLVDFDRQIELANRKAMEYLTITVETGDGR